MYGATLAQKSFVQWASFPLGAGLGGEEGKKKVGDLETAYGLPHTPHLKTHIKSGWRPERDRQLQFHCHSGRYASIERVEGREGKKESG